MRHSFGLLSKPFFTARSESCHVSHSMLCSNAWKMMRLNDYYGVTSNKVVTYLMLTNHMFDPSDGRGRRTGGTMVDACATRSFAVSLRVTRWKVGIWMAILMFHLSMKYIVESFELHGISWRAP